MDFNTESILFILLAVFSYFIFSCSEKYENFVMDETTDYSKDTFDNLELNLTKIIGKSNNEVMPQDETPGIIGSTFLLKSILLQV